MALDLSFFAVGPSNDSVLTPFGHTLSGVLASFGYVRHRRCTRALFQKCEWEKDLNHIAAPADVAVQSLAISVAFNFLKYDISSRSSRRSSVTSTSHAFTRASGFAGLNLSKRDAGFDMAEKGMGAVGIEAGHLRPKRQMMRRLKPQWNWIHLNHCCNRKIQTWRATTLPAGWLAC